MLLCCNLLDSTNNNKNSVNNYALIDTVVTHPDHKVQGYANERYFE